MIGCITVTWVGVIAAVLFVGAMGALIAAGVASAIEHRRRH